MNMSRGQFSKASTQQIDKISGGEIGMTDKMSHHPANRFRVNSTTIVAPETEATPTQIPADAIAARNYQKGLVLNSDYDRRNSGMTFPASADQHYAGQMENT